MEQKETPEEFAERKRNYVDYRRNVHSVPGQMLHNIWQADKLNYFIRFLFLKSDKQLKFGALNEEGDPATEGEDKPMEVEGGGNSGSGSGTSSASGSGTESGDKEYADDQERELDFLSLKASQNAKDVPKDFMTTNAYKKNWDHATLIYLQGMVAQILERLVYISDGETRKKLIYETDFCDALYNMLHYFCNMPHPPLNHKNPDPVEQARLDAIKEKKKLEDAGEHDDEEKVADAIIRQINSSSSASEDEGLPDDLEARKIERIK